jgi:hypothetical protein
MASFIKKLHIMNTSEGQCLRVHWGSQEINGISAGAVVLTLEGPPKSISAYLRALGPRLEVDDPISALVDAYDDILDDSPPSIVQSHSALELVGSPR